MAWRQFVADPWVSTALALLVAAVSFLLTAAPRALEDVNGRQLTSDVAALSPVARDVTGGWGTTAEYPAGEQGPAPAQTQDQGADSADSADPWAPFREGAERIRAAQPEPLRSMLLEPQMTARVTQVMAATPGEGSPYFEARITPVADPDLAEHVDLVEGEWPSPDLIYPTTDEFGVPVGPEPGTSEEDAAPTGLGVLVLRESMDEARWEVGEQLGPNLFISGIYEPKDPEDPRWAHIDNSVSMGVLVDVNRGEAAQIALFLSPQSRGVMLGPTSVRMELWYPVDPRPLVEDRVDPSVVRAQLTGMIGQQHIVVAKGDPMLGSIEGDQVPAFSSDLTSTLDNTVRQQRATASLLAVVGAGPLGVALAVMALAARLVVHRRRPALAMTLARGASPQQVRGLVALEGLALGVPAALAGHALARLVWPGTSRWWEWLITLLVALAPAVALALSLDDASLLQRRSDLSSRAGGRWRWVGELAVVALAGLATWRLLDRDARGDDAGESGIDLLAAATPLLLALAACVIALRLYPLPLAALTRMLRGGRGLTPFLGAARALRDPAGGLVPALAVILGTSVALISAILLTTITQGAEDAAWTSNGADISAGGPVIDDETVAQISELPGVAAVARVREAGNPVQLVQGEEQTQVRILIADSELAQVLGPRVEAPSPSLYADPTTIRLSVGGDTPPTKGPATLRGVNAPVEVVEYLTDLPGVRTPIAWAVVDRAAWEAAGREVPLARQALISTTPGADRGEVADAVSELLGSSVVTTVDQELSDFRTSAVTRGLTTAFVAATVLTGLLTVLAIVVVQLMGSRARMQLLSVLRTLGLAPGQTRALTGWELAPMLATAMLVGAVLGAAVPWVLVKALDLRGLTGGEVQPDLHLDPLVIGAVLGAVILTVLLAITVSAWSAGRANLAQALRVGEER
ncbi:ABC transporter permease [Ornithinimicrobium panacihumi]|uniref:ABC transporter permease n=1 Tax=Ornithinimicrobium panacihumi TaxID=2008449 RepID=UPI003F8A6DCD